MTEPRPSGFQIRDVRPDELDEVSRVNGCSFEEYAASLPALVWGDYIKNIMDVRSRLSFTELIVAEHLGQVVGSVTFYPDGSRYGEEVWPDGWAGLRLLAVHPESRGVGLGRALVQECIRRCRQRGIPTLGLHSTEAMRVARGMYERMGFIRAPEFDFHPTSRTTVVAYRLDL
jgi:predicted N-acetyltransferase YhbS